MTNPEKSPDRLLRPSSDPSLFIKAAQSCSILLKDAGTALGAIQSRPFAERLMDAAEKSDGASVKDMIRKTGVMTQPEIHYSPDGLTLAFKSSEGPEARVVLHLQWKRF